MHTMSNVDNRSNFTRKWSYRYFFIFYVALLLSTSYGLLYSISTDSYLLSCIMKMILFSFTSFLSYKALGSRTLSIAALPVYIISAIAFYYPNALFIPFTKSALLSICSLITSQIIAIHVIEGHSPKEELVSSFVLFFSLMIISDTLIMSIFYYPLFTMKPAFFIIKDIIYKIFMIIAIHIIKHYTQ